MSEDTSFEYRVFISYRHVQRDRTWAEWLIKELENYRLPRRLQKKYSKSLGKMFRDRNELPSSGNLTEQIRQALINSEFLVVICSPATPESRWISREIEIFKELGREDKIFPLLIDGEPEESYPPVLTTSKLIDFDEVIKNPPIPDREPIGSDFRELPGVSPRKIRKLEFLRLVSGILGCKYDELVQRQAEAEKQKKFITSAFATFIVSIFCVALTIYVQSQREKHQEISRALIDVGKDLRESGEFDIAVKSAIVAAKDSFLSPADRESRIFLNRLIADDLRVSLLIDHEETNRKISHSELNNEANIAIISYEGRPDVNIFKKGGESSWMESKISTNGKLISKLHMSSATSTFVVLLEDVNKNNRSIMVGKSTNSEGEVWQLEDIGSLDLAVEDIKISPSGNTVAVTTDKGEIVIFWKGGDFKWNEYRSKVANVQNLKLELEFSTDGQLLLASSRSISKIDKMYLFSGETSNWKPLNFQLSSFNPNWNVLDVKFVPDTQSISLLYSYQKPSRVLKGYKSQVENIANLGFWKRSKADYELWQYSGNSGPASDKVAPSLYSNNNVHVLSNGKEFASVSHGNNLYLYNSENYPDSTTVGKFIRSFTSSLSGKVVALYSDNGLYTWRKDREERAESLLKYWGSDKYHSNIKILNNDKILSSTGELGIRMWKIPALDETDGQSRNVHPLWITDLKFSHDSQHFVSLSDEGPDAYLWSLTDTGAWRYQYLEGHGTTVGEAYFSNDSKRLLTHSVEGTTKIWSKGTGLEWSQFTLMEGQTGVHSAFFSPDGQTVVHLLPQGGVRIWQESTNNGWNSSLIGKSDEIISSAQFSESGNCLMTKNQSSEMRVWHRESDGWSLKVSQLKPENDNSNLSILDVGTDCDEYITYSFNGEFRNWRIDKNSSVLTNSLMFKSPSPDYGGVSYYEDAGVILVNGDLGLRVWSHQDNGVWSQNFIQKFEVGGVGDSILVGDLILSSGDNLSAWYKTDFGQWKKIDLALINSDDRQFGDVALSPDGKYLVAEDSEGGLSGELRIFSMEWLPYALKDQSSKSNRDNLSKYDFNRYCERLSAHKIYFNDENYNSFVAPFVQLSEKDLSFNPVLSNMGYRIGDNVCAQSTSILDKVLSSLLPTSWWSDI